MKTSKIFLSVQGEGPNIGTPFVFIRLSGCNLRCNFCDTKYTWKNGENLLTSFIVKRVREKAFGCRNVCITGGEPLLQQKELEELMQELLLKSPFYFFEIETNGTIAPSKRMLELVDSWIVSPKLSNAGVKQYTMPEEFFKNKRGSVVFKFVVDNNWKDVIEVREYVESDKNFSYIENEEIFLMPLATTKQEHNQKLPFIISFAKKYGYRVTPRLQILAYGNKKGV